MSSVLTIDFETRSDVDLKKTGVFPYAQGANSDVWCAAWAIDDEPVELWKMGDPVPARLVAHVASGGILAAWNASFEIAIWTHILTPRYGWPLPQLEQWRCSMVAAYAMALPGALENAAGSVGLDIGKDQAGKRLMLAMSKPRKVKKGEIADGLLWRDNPEDLERLYLYCKTDVEVERAIRARLVALRASEQDLWHLDQKINTRGVLVDVDLAKKALALVEHQEAKLDKEMANVTDYAVTACTNLNQLKIWLKAKGVELGSKLNKKTMAYVDTLDKEFVEELLATETLDPAVRRALELRQEAGKASVAKINAILNGMSADGRARGLLQFHAANTGRWAGRRFQPQNLRRPPEDFDCDGAIDVITRYPTQKAADILDAMYDAPMSCLSYILRGLIRAAPGKKIIAADFSGIESRVLAWLAGEEWKLKFFRDFDAGIIKYDNYKATAGKILGIDPMDVTKADRQIYGKVPELACGFQGGVGAFQAMAHTFGVTIADADADKIKTDWRAAHPNIEQFWWDLEEAGLRALASPGKVVTCGMVKFKVNGSFLWLQLPSGRALCYPYPAIRQILTPWGQWKDAITFKTVLNVSNVRKIVDDPSNTSRWARISTYGGGLAENVTQAAARDLLAEAMVRLEAAGYPIILTCHDENVSEVDEGFGSVAEYEAIMCELPAWAKGLPVAASGFESERYRK